MGPRSRYLGSDVPTQEFIWQDPLPRNTSALIEADQINELKAKIIQSGIPTAHLVKAAWASASTFRYTDQRGGANGGRIRLHPQDRWEVNDPQELATVIAALEKISSEFNQNRTDGKKVSLADLIVLAGNAAIEESARRGGSEIRVPFRPGRTDASQDQTDVDSFAVLEPKADGFRNFYGAESQQSPLESFIDRAALLKLTIPETAVLLAGLRAMDANTHASPRGVLTLQPGVLSNDFFVNLLDASTVWTKSIQEEGLFEGRTRDSGQLKWTATPIDLIFGSNSELRAVAEAYAAGDAKQQFLADFVLAWNKVMELDRFDLN